MVIVLKVKVLGRVGMNLKIEKPESFTAGSSRKPSDYTDTAARIKARISTY